MRTANHNVEDLLTATGVEEGEYFVSLSAFLSARTDEEDNDDDKDDDEDKGNESDGDEKGDENNDDNPPLDEKVVHSPLTTETGGKPKK